MIDIRILHIISGNDSGGAKTHLMSLCINSAGLFENIVGCINEGILYEESIKSGIQTIVFKQKSRFDVSVSTKIKSYIAENRIDIVNFHGANPNFLYVLLKKIIQIPCVTTIHSDYRFDFINNKIKYLLFTPMNSVAIRNFQNYICVSEKIKTLLEHKGMKGHKYVVHNGINPNFRIREDRKKIRCKYDIDDDSFVYTMVARMHPIKNHMNLIEAFAKLVHEYDDVKLLLVGDGEYEGKIKKSVSELGLEGRVIFTGRRDNALDYMNAGDINILTSFNETFPIVVLEGALVKKTVICSDVGDMKKVINEKSGFIVNPHIVDDIYDKMKIAYIGKDRLEAMGQNLHDIVLNQYTVKKFCLRYYDSYKRIIEGDRNG